MTNFLGLKTMTSAFLAPDTIYARDGETLRKFIWTANALADQEREIERLRGLVCRLEAEVSRLNREREDYREKRANEVLHYQQRAIHAEAHVSRLEESLRVALEARAEAVEVLGEILPVAESHPDMGPNMSAAVDRAQSFVRRAIGKGE